MAPSLFSPNSCGSSSRRSGKEISNSLENRDGNNAIQWKSEAQRRNYSSKLSRALQYLRVSGGASGERPPPTRRVQDAAYRVLATAAKGRSRWSRAILSTRLKMSFMKRNTMVKRRRKFMNSVITAGGYRLQRKSKLIPPRQKSSTLPAFQRKARLLSKLIPGCRRQPILVVLEEVIDYIPALEMQVRAMSELAQRLSATGFSSSGSEMAPNDVGSSGVPPN